ncbi:MAG: hypothetical protein ABSG72_02925 [Candidatus Sulfotelmatobacter sp.]|jgi:hypothetical protein
MNGTTARFLRLGVSLSGLMVLGWVLTGQAAKPIEEGIPTDWSHRHVIFSRPATFEQVGQITSDPRYWQQWYRQNVARVLSDPAAGDADSIGPGAEEANSEGAWSEDLGSGGSVGAGNYPAKYSFQITTANCASAASPDYVVFNTGLAGSTGQASVVAYDNLYSGCTGTKPMVYWAYNTGGQVLTSPTISEDGTQVAFVETSSGFGVLVLLKWAASTTETVGSPMTLTPVTASAYRSCVAPCMTGILLKNSSLVQVNDITSSVFPDYQNDVIWVGGALGWLHKISGVFKGTPAEVITGGFPVQVNPVNPTSLSSPAYDRTSANVFVGDYGGFFYRVSSTGAVTASGKVDHGAGLVAGPIVDSTAEKIYVFSSSDGSTTCTGGVPCSAVFEFVPTFAPGTTGTEAVVGISQTAPPNPNPLYEGSFDNTYDNSGDATGNLYVCGNTAGAPTLYQIPIAAGVMGTALTGPVLTSATTGCSPVTDIPNPNATGGATEFIFASAQASGSGNNCAAGGCIMNFKVEPWQPSTAYTVGQEILDTNLHIQVVRTAGTSRTAAQGHPTWNVNIDGSTADNTVRWTNQGPHLASHPAWQPSHAYTVGQEILDSNGAVEWVRTAGTSRTPAQGHPTWSLVVGGPTVDNTVSWRMVGPVATFSFAATGGTSGIIMDNVVSTGTLAGASQVYFSTLSNQTCITSLGTGGCATQVSQAALQ